MKKFIIFIVTLVVIVLCFRYISFSETRGLVVDENGKPISQAKVSISYSCDVTRFADSGNHSFKNDTTETDSDGKFVFGSYSPGLKFRPLYLTGCYKVVGAFKEGYCNDLDLCKREILSNGVEKIVDSKSGMKESNLLYRNGKYFESAYFLTSQTIGNKDAYLSLILKTFSPWFQ